MTELNDTLRARLSAFLDGELSPAESDAVALLAEKDPEIAAELESLQSTDDALKAAFDDLLSEPVPLDLVRSIADPEEPSSATTPEAANLPSAPGRWGFGAIAAGIAALAVTGLLSGYAGYTLAPEKTVVAQRGWMADVADYHRVYAQESRHLAEVPPEEAAHIVEWIGARTGVPFSIPDLSAQGITFEGARLLVAGGKPVAQLLYKAEDGTVFALCFLQSGNGATDGIGSTDFEGVTMATWRTDTAAYVFVGPEGNERLPELAAEAAEQV
ncbi:anti-sigma factor family protein [Algicella marina]|uniref:Anti-sigma factor n=1 Tax=Algicella marina TaxID=2683284 RepID=A0A6P1T2Z2_9RHOB|nr:anti-sigma factor [Algicella marina]QHQ36033.1 anti-sigma factor [Algicella marina]